MISNGPARVLCGACLCSILLSAGLTAQAAGSNTATEQSDRIEDIWPQVLSLPTTDIGREDAQPETQAESVTWGRALPFLAQQVIDLGYDLPKPYGIGVVAVAIEQDLLLSELEVAVDGEPIDTSFVSFGEADARNKSLQLKADAWLFPFMNVFVVGGRVDGKANIELSIPTEDLIDAIRPELCKGPLRPPICDEVVDLNLQTNYEGNTIGVGTVLAGGWNQYFVTVAVTWVETDLDIVDSEIRTLNASPRVGITLPLKSREHVVALFVGGNYLDAELDLTGTIDLNIPGVGPGKIDYKINQKNKDEWNYLIGANYDLGRHWNFNAEIGFGGSRDNIFAGATYRW